MGMSAFHVLLFLIGVHHPAPVVDVTNEGEVDNRRGQSSLMVAAARWKRRGAANIGTIVVRHSPHRLCFCLHRDMLEREIARCLINVKMPLLTADGASRCLSTKLGSSATMTATACSVAFSPKNRPSASLCCSSASPLSLPAHLSLSSRRRRQPSSPSAATSHLSPVRFEPLCTEPGPGPDSPSSKPARPPPQQEQEQEQENGGKEEDDQGRKGGINVSSRPRPRPRPRPPSSKSARPPPPQEQENSGKEEDNQGRKGGINMSSTSSSSYKPIETIILWHLRRCS
ncbi:probable serine/threonine-protein kinase samkC [Triticum aestivum]|uniref:probable serine/threonine-protein kinase samkC n=1 Tax=Triticum aestivum TaxID=4565 RepID=UPI001D011840|nr:probable serine/threonine-protein kinase samkC [Triticum aestivum]